MKKLVWLSGEEVGVVEHSMMVVEETDDELRVLRTGDAPKIVKQFATVSSTCGGASRTIDVYQYLSEWDRVTGWVKVATYRRGIQVFRARAARA